MPTSATGRCRPGSAIRSPASRARGRVPAGFYSHASFARFIEWAFNLPTLGAADDLSTYTAGEPKPGNLRDFFDFSGSPPKGKDILPVRVCPKLTRAQRTLAATEPDD
jgi:hypothetical protein